MPKHDPIPPRRPKRPRMDQTTARTVRRWTIGLGVSAFLLIAMAPFTNGTDDRIVSILAAATLITGAIVIPRPTGFRAILAVTAMLCVMVAVGIIRA